MTPTEWRKRHKRCRFCMYYRVREVGIENYSLAECTAKDKRIRIDAVHPFCKVYKAREE